MPAPSVADALAAFHPAVREWFGTAFEAPTRAQTLSWPELQAGRSTLLFAPTGSGKTLAAFLTAIERLMFRPAPAEAERCRVVYVSPLRALAVDVERNLRAPLSGIARVAERRGTRFHAPTLAIRSGDTPSADRVRMARHPPDVLITTPESLFLVLTSNARAMLASVELVIVDEIHALVGTKRGAHLALSLERLAERCRSLQRVGLSATQRPLEEVARYLGGGEPGPGWRPRPVSIVDAGARKAFDLRVEVPVEDMAHPGGDAPGGAGGARQSIWPAIHPRLVELIRAHRSTLVFVNSRRLAERIADALNELAGQELARAHHGSVAREQRLEIEDALKAGRLPALVATSSLELGIDMGAVDLVIQIETPPSVASGMQRIGRASHQVEAVSRGVIFPKFRADLLAAAATVRAMLDGAVEATRIPRNPLDVLAQQLVAICVERERSVDELCALVGAAAPYAALERGQLEGVLDMLSGRYPSEEFAELRPRLVWDRLRNVVRAREGARRLAVTNAGTIPDRGLYGVYLADDGATGRRTSRRVGELDEEMVFESREGEVFVLGATSWRILEIDRDRVLVAPAPGEPGKMPFWKADRGARPAELGRAIGRLTRELAQAPRPAARRRLVERHALEPRAADNLLDYLAEQKQATEALPDDATLVLERTRDELGDWRLCLLSPWGGRIHAPWAFAIQARLRAAGEGEAETLWSDDGIVVRLPDRDAPPDAADLVPDPDEIRELVTRELGGTALFAAYFREAAGRALLLPRRRPGQRTPLWMQRKRSADLLAVASRYPSFPIVLETFRECLQDVFDVPGLVKLAESVRRREIRLVTADTRVPSPFAASLLFGYVANYLYDGDAPLAERRAQALAVDPYQLRELLGEAELRELLDADALAELEERLQCRSESYRARSPDQLHDLLLRLGDLTGPELAERSLASPEARREWLLGLQGERRIIALGIAGETRYAAAEDAGRLRDALGAVPPPGLPAAFLGPSPRGLLEVVGRYARTRGPFGASDVASRFGLGAAVAQGALAELEREGRLLQGEFRPGGHGREWCDAEVLKTLRRRSLARLRSQVEPVEPDALGRLALQWHGIGAASPTRSGPDALLDVVEQLQGAELPASALESEVLPARLPGYRPADMDALCAAGEVIWVGVAPLGSRDGRVALFLAEDLPLIGPTPGEAPRGELHERLREKLESAGACFFDELHAAAGGGLVRPVLDALWDLVWCGEVTNDTPAAFRAFLRHRSAAGRGRERRLRAVFRSRRQSPPAAVGRWSRIRPEREASRAERGLALAAQLLARHGVLTREAVRCEGFPGGFATVYPALKALEEAGRARRGYFVAGLGGLQFAHPEALERLRIVRDGSGDDAGGAGTVLAATDPANPYGAALPWPATEGARPRRAAGVYVVLVDGALAAFLGRDAREIDVFLPEHEPERSKAGRAVAEAIRDWAQRSGRSVLGASSSGAPLSRGPLAPYLAGAGLSPWGPGFRVPASGSPTGGR